MQTFYEPGKLTLEILEDAISKLYKSRPTTLIPIGQISSTKNKSKMFIYHKEIGLPESLLIPKEVVVTLRYTNHAKERMERDNYKLIVIPSVVKVTADNIVEAYTTDKINLKKIVIRIPYDRNRDIVLVLQPEFNKLKAKVITFWLNHKTDNHPSLDKTKYTKL